MKVFGWTNPALGTAARNQEIGFTVGEITVSNLTVGVQYYWNSSMPSGSWIQVDTGAYTAANGFTPLAQSTAVGATISGFTNANPGVITVNDTAIFGFAAGDTIKVCALADDLSTANSLNGTFTVASITSTTITLVEDTTLYSVYVSGGDVFRVTDSAGDPVPIDNLAIRGVTIGSSVVGTNSDVMVGVAKSEEPVV